MLQIKRKNEYNLKKMNPLFKKLLFFLCCLAFLIIGPILVLRAQGFRFDLERKKIVKTGGILIKAFPKQIKVFLNGKFQKETDVLFGGAFLKNLLPKKYELILKKEDYFPSKKEIIVKEKEITEVRDIILFPRNLKWEKVLDGIDDFWGVYNEKKFLVKEKEENEILFKIFDLEKKIRMPFLKKEDLSLKPFNLMWLYFFENTARIKIKEGEMVREFEIKIVNSIPKITEIKKNEILSFLKTNEGAFWLKNNGEFYKEKEKIGNFEKINENKDYALESISGKIFLKEFNSDSSFSLYFFNPETQHFEKIFENGKKILPTFNKRAMLILSPYEIWILDLQSFEKKFLLRISSEIKDAFWITEKYLIFNTENKIFISETDPKNLNLIEVEGVNFKKIWFLNKRIYLLSNDTLFCSQPLLP